MPVGAIELFPVELFRPNPVASFIVKVTDTPFALFVGPIFAVVLYAMLPRQFLDSNDVIANLSADTRIVISIAGWMAIWWITEAVPLAVTALLPLALFPAIGVISFKTAANSYAHPLIFLFFGGFLVSIALQKWTVHRRFAISLLHRVGTQPARLVGGFMLATAFLSMWLSNTATTIMMLPIALSIVGRDSGGSPFSRCLLLSIAYSASIGGMATIIGTPPNLYVASYFNEILDVEIGFLEWMMIGIPCAAVLLPIAWIYLTRIRYRLPDQLANDVVKLGGRGLIWNELERGGQATLIIFGLLVCGWIGRPWIIQIEAFGLQPFSHLTDAGLALLAACALFICPTDLKQRRFVLEWPDTTALPWGTLLLFGGGLCLAATVNATGTDDVLGMWLSRLHLDSQLLVTLLIVLIVILLTELTSNIATTATLVPILAAAAPLLGLHTNMIIVMVALAASCAFMLPVATPPNAIVFGSGHLSGPEMARAGLIMNGVALLVIGLLGYGLVPLVLP